MPNAAFILFNDPRRWRVARADAGKIDWFECDVDDADAAPTVAALLREHGYAGGPAVLAVASEDCLAVRVSTAGLPRGDRRAMTYRLEELLPMAAEEIVADFAPPSTGGDVLAACVTLDRTGPLVAALEAAGVTIGAIVPAALAAAQALAPAFGEDDIFLMLDEPQSAATRLSVVTLRAGVPVDWALLPADAADVALHLGLVAADLQITPRVCAAGLAEALADDISVASGCVVNRQDDGVAGAAATFAVGVIGGRERAWFEFRRDALAASDPARQFRRPVNLLLGAAAALLAAITVTLFLRAAAYDRAGEASRTTLTVDFRTHFPGWVIPANVPAVVAAERRKALSAVAAPAADGATYGSAMTTLQTLLGGLPENGRFALDTLSVQDTSLSIAGRLTAFEQADAIAAAARRSGMDVPPPQTRRAATGTWAFVLQGTRAADKTTAKASAAADSAADRGVASR